MVTMCTTCCNTEELATFPMNVIHVCHLIITVTPTISLTVYSVGCRFIVTSTYEMINTQKFVFPYSSVTLSTPLIVGRVRPFFLMNNVLH